MLRNNKSSTLTPQECQEFINFPTLLTAIVTPDGKLYKVNEDADPVFGWEPREVLGRPLQDFVHPDDWDETLGTMAGLFLGTKAMVSDFRNRCRQKDGSYRWVNWTAKTRGGFLYAMGTDVTDKVEIEEQLKTQVMVLESISEGVVIYDKDFRILYLNSALEKLFGYEAGEALGQDAMIFNAYKDEDLELISSVVNEALDSDGIWMGEWLNKKKDGTQFMTAARLTLLHSDKKVIVCVLRDITEKKQIQAEQDALQKSLGLAVKVGKVGVWQWVPGSSNVTWNETLEEIYGFLPGTFPGTAEAYTNCIYPDDRDKLWKTVDQAMKEGKSYAFEHRVIHQTSNKIRWVQCSGMCFYDKDGTLVNMMGTSIDITDTKLAGEEQRILAEASEILSESFDYKKTLDKLAEFISRHFCDGCTIDQLHPNGEIERIIVSPLVPEIRKKIIDNHVSYSPDFQQDHPQLTALITGKTQVILDVSKIWSEMRAKHSSNYVDELESLNLNQGIIVRLKGRDNLLGVVTFFNFKGSKFHFEKRHQWLAEELCYRISYSLENSLLYQNSQDAIRARDEFLSIASHELKTPLTSLTLLNNMMKRNTANYPESPESKNTMRLLEAENKQLVRINRLIDDMLDMTRIKAEKLTIHKEDFELNGFVSDVLERFKPQLESVGSDLNSSLSSAITVHADIHRIEQVLVNLLTNAMKYGSGKPVKVEVYNYPTRIKVMVTDRGPGIKHDDIDRIFLRFERAVSNNDVTGLGLGLYISRQIMEQHEGSLTVQSTRGKGSTFIMELPLNP